MTTSLRWTSAGLEVLPDSGKRYEIIDGELYVSRQPDWNHQSVCLWVGELLDEWSTRTGAGEPNIAPGVIFADDDDAAPDVVWVSAERLASLDPRRAPARRRSWRSRCSHRGPRTSGATATPS